MYFQIVSPVQKNFSCTENIPKSVVVGSDGSISPCVMKQIPVRGENYYYIKGQKLLQQNLSFGNVQDDSLNMIWHQQEYPKFLLEFRRDNTPSICRDCRKNCVDDFV